MWIVQLALRRPYSVATLCLVVLLMGMLSAFGMQVDIFPEVNIPVVVVVWSYPGLSAEDMERRVVLISERGMSTSVSGITHIESSSMNGIGVERVYFEPDADIGGAIAQIDAASLSAQRVMPPGIQPPTLLRFNATNVQVAQITVGGEGQSEQELYDYGLNFLRIRLFTIPGLSTPAPYGGKTRQVMVDVDVNKVASKGLAPQDVVNTLLNQNVILPAGSARMGQTDYDVLLNSSPDTAPDFNALPLKVVNGATVYLGDVASVHDGYATQQNIVRVNGKRATYLSILKKENSSTLAVVDAAKEMLPAMKAAAPAGMELKLAFDQSEFVRGAVTGVLREACISAGLVALMTLVFIGSWRSTIIVCISIPLSILVGIIVLKLTGQTLNLMTLGGLSLAIGMLVDDATVEVENINRNRKEDAGMSIGKAILDAASQIAVPAMAATLTICIVFFPVVMLTGPSKYLFYPLAIAVVGSMLASYLLSRTLVPTLAFMLLGKEKIEGADDEGNKDTKGQKDKSRSDGEKDGQESEEDRHAHESERMEQEDLVFDPKPKQLKLPLPKAPKSALARKQEANKKKASKAGWIAKIDKKREHAFERLQDAYASLLGLLLGYRKTVVAFGALMAVTSFVLVASVGLDFFPSVDAGMLKMHFRAPPGTRIEETERLVDAVERKARAIIPEAELDTINDNIGIPTSYNLGFIPTDSVNGSDAEILVALQKKHKPSIGYAEQIRAEVKRDFPGSVLYFEAADIVTQVLNFGASSPIDVQVEGQDWTKTYPIAAKLEAEMNKIPGAEDIRISQVLNHPSLKVDVDRERAAQVGLTEHDVASSLLTSLSSSSLLSPNYWVNPTNGVNYVVAVQTPIDQIHNIGDLLSTPITSGTQTVGPLTSSYGTSYAPQFDGTTMTNQSTVQNIPPLLGQLASVKATIDRALVTHYTVQPVIDVQASVEKRDLGGVASDIQKVIDHLGPLGKGISVKLRGQSETMYSSFQSLGLGMLVAIALVYLLMVVLFQSWIDPLIIMVAVPGAFSGIMWMLTITGTTLNVESLMGSIMAIGIAVSNSILLVTFANDARAEGKDIDSAQAALLAGKTRLRPVIMTALAMLFGMLPMAFGLGEGGEQNAPLGRAVIGGILAATVTTLFVVPCVYALARKSPPRKEELDRRIDEAQAEGEEDDEGNAKSKNDGRTNGQQEAHA